MQKDIKKIGKNNALLVKGLLDIENAKRSLMSIDKQLFNSFIYSLPFEKKEIIVDKRTYKERHFNKEIKELENIEGFFSLSDYELSKMRLKILNKFILPNYFFKGTYLDEMLITQKQIKDMLIFANFGIINKTIISKIPQFMFSDNTTITFLSEFISSAYRYNPSKNVLFSTFITTRLRTTVNKLVNSSEFRDKMSTEFYEGHNIKQTKNKDTSKIIINLMNFGFFTLLEEVSPALVLELEENNNRIYNLLNKIIGNSKNININGTVYNIEGLRNSIENRFKELNKTLYSEILNIASSTYSKYRIMIELIMDNKFLEKSLPKAKKFKNQDLSNIEAGNEECERVKYLEISKSSDFDEDFFNNVAKDIILFTFKYILKKMSTNNSFKMEILKDKMKEDKIEILEAILKIINNGYIKTTEIPFKALKNEERYLMYGLEDLITTGQIEAKDKYEKLIASQLKEEEVVNFIKKEFSL